MELVQLRSDGSDPSGSEVGIAGIDAVGKAIFDGTEGAGSI